MTSGPVVPGLVKGEWVTPSLANGNVYFWRARTMDGKILGNWVTSAFSTSNTLPTSPMIRWRESSSKQFAREALEQATATDSGVTIAANPSIQLYARSLGSRWNPDQDYYSIIRLNEQTIFGLPFVLGSGFMVLRVNEFSGAYDFKSFNVPGQAAQADSMKNFLNNTPVGNYIVIAVIVNGTSNVSESLYVAIESLGSTMIRQVQPGQSWALIGQKGEGGPGMPPLESLTNDSAVVSLEVPNFYSVGSGSVTTTGLSTPTSWDSFHWRHGPVPTGTDIRVALLGVRSNGVADTLRMLSMDSTDVSLDFLNPLTSGPTYTRFKSAALLTTEEALVTPSLTDWWVDFVPPADLAVSSRTVGVTELVVERGSLLNLPVTVHNIGFHGVDSARVVVSMYDKYNKARPIASAQLDTIPVDGTQSTIFPIETTNFPRRVTLQIRVSPSKKYKDLVAENNIAYYTFDVTGSLLADVQLFADGVQLMDGDFISPKPKILVTLPQLEEGSLGARQVELFVDNRSMTAPGGDGSTRGRDQSSPIEDNLIFTPELSNGQHELKVRVVQLNSFGEADSLDHSVMVIVQDEMRILQVFNYPNPFASDTYFTFVLTSRLPEELTIRIFTITGRRIREISVPGSALKVGPNRVYWDGRDTDGDEIANGYYFYQVSIKGEGKIEAAIEKLVKLR
ncbi:MAG: hypothetical protein O7D34_06165, partial [Ignavibacteria bacterium]|nr:hypothetical protein [Ignavibacteria bacterium]